MIEIELQQAPNQSFSIDIDGVTFDITLKTASYTVADVYIGSDLVISGVRVMPYRPIVPYEYLEQGAGNFFFVTDNGEYPSYSEFGMTQSLVYLTAAEVEALNAY